MEAIGKSAEAMSRRTEVLIEMTRKLIREFALDIYAFLVVVLFLIGIAFFLGHVDVRPNHLNVGAPAKKSDHLGPHF